MHCPSCQSTRVGYSENRFLHFVRFLSLSPKRHCLICHHKWRIKSHANRSRFPWMLVVLGAIAAMVFFYWMEKLSVNRNQQKRSESEFLQQIPEEMAGMDREEAMNKLKIYRNNPAALNQLDPSKRKMVEKALSLTKD